MSFEVLFPQLMTGMSRAAVLFIVAAGLSLVFGAMRIVNLAHGSFYMLGAFVAVTISGAVGGTVGFIVALVTVPLVIAVIAGLIEMGVLRRLYGKEHLLQLLATFALLLIVQDVVRFFWGERPQRIQRPDFLGGSMEIFGSTFPKYSLFLIGAALVLAVGLWLLMSRTGLGRDIRAAVTDPEMLRMVGVNVPMLFTVVFALGAALAAIGGILYGPQTTVLLGMDVDMIIQAFAVVIIGGLGSMIGTAIGSVLVGVTFSVSILYFPEGAMGLVFAVMVIVLMWRPTGLFGIKERG